MLFGGVDHAGLMRRDEAVSSGADRPGEGLADYTALSGMGDGFHHDSDGHSGN
jgi:hypothetical protein